MTKRRGGDGPPRSSTGLTINRTSLQAQTELSGASIPNPVRLRHFLEENPETGRQFDQMIEKGQFEEARRFLTNTREKAEVATIAAKLSPASLKLLPCLASRTNPGNADSAKTRLELRGFGLTKQDRRWRHDLVLTERGRAVLAALLAKGER